MKRLLQMNLQKDRYVGDLLILFFGFYGVLCVLFATYPGAGLTADSIDYIAAARNLLNGEGLANFIDGRPVPMNHWPPMFPLLLAMLGSIGLDPLLGVRWLNATMFGAIIILVGYIIRRTNIDSLYAPAFASLLLLSSVQILQIHTMAWSEPTFIFFGVLGLFLLACYLENNRRSFLVIASGATAIAFLTRYVGVAFCLAGLIGLLVLSRRTFREKIVDILLFGSSRAGQQLCGLPRTSMLELA